MLRALFLLEKKMTKIPLVIYALMALLPLIGCVHQAISPIRAIRTATIRVALPPDQALPLFTPFGEKAWSKGWEYAPLLPADGSTELNMVFTTSKGNTIWTMVDDN